MKKIFTLMAVFALALAANAQKADFAVTGEGNDWIIFSLDNDFNCGAFGFKLVLPEGTDLAYSEDDEDFIYEKNSSRLPKKMTVDVKPAASGGYSIVVSGALVKESTGELFRMQLKNPITGTATISGINFTDVGEDGKGTVSVYMNNDKNTTLTLDLKADAINGINAEQTKSGVIYNVAGQRVSKAQKGIFIVDGKKVAVK